MGFFPFYMGIILALLSIKNLTKAIAQRKIATDVKTSGEDINWKNIIVTVVVLFCFPLFLDFLGFSLSVFFFTAFFLRFINPPQRWSVVLGMGGAVAIVFYLVFQYWLKIQFPSGIFGV